MTDSDIFQIIHCVAATRAKTNPKEFETMVLCIGQLIPTSRLKLMIQAKLPLLQYAASPLEWSYELEKSYSLKPMMPFDGFLIYYDPKKMDIPFWSRPMWKVIHQLADNYDLTETYALYFKAFISSLQFVLPCGKCREHLAGNLATIPIDMYMYGDRTRLYQWSNQLHTMVTEQVKKSGGTHKNDPPIQNYTIV